VGTFDRQPAETRKVLQKQQKCPALPDLPGNTAAQCQIWRCWLLRPPQIAAPCTEQPPDIFQQAKTVTHILSLGDAVPNSPNYGYP
jgi:hypothetical protein